MCRDHDITTIERQARNLFDALAEDGYYALSSQKELFAEFEGLIREITHLPFDTLEQKTALFFAAGFYKAANIYRRIAHQESLILALKYHQKAIAIRQVHFDQYALEIGHSLSAIGATYNELKGKDNNLQAIHYYRQALSIYEVNKHDGMIHAASVLHMLGNAYRDLDDTNSELAISFVNRALSIINALPDSEYNRQEKAKFLYNQGVNYRLLSGEPNLEIAIRYLHEAKIAFELINDPVRLSMTLGYLGDTYRSYREFTSAIEYLNQALSLQKDLLGEEHSEVAKTLYYLGLAHKDIKNFETAENYFKEALKIQKKLFRVDHPYLIKTLQSLNDIR